MIVLCFALTSTRIVVALENKVYVYNFADLQLIHQIETTANLKGLFFFVVVFCVYLLNEQVSSPCLLIQIIQSLPAQD